VGKLEDAAKYVHLVIPDTGRVAGALGRAVSLIVYVMGSPLLGFTIEGPNVAQFTVIIFLTTEHVKLFVSADAHSSASSGNGAIIVLVLATTDDLTTETVAFVLELDDLVGATAANVSTKGEEGSILHVSTGMVVSANVLDIGVELDGRPDVVGEIQSRYIRVSHAALDSAEEADVLRRDHGAGMMRDLTNFLAAGGEALPSDLLAHS